MVAASVQISEMTTSSDIAQNATVVISHRVREGLQGDYEKWLGEIVPVSKTYTGHVDVTVIRPVPGASERYTVIVRFDSREHLTAWLNSPERKTLIERARPLLVEDDKYEIQSGLDFWFTPEGSKAKVPTRWKQSLVTWSAIYPLVLITPLILGPVFRFLGVVDNHYLKTLLVTGAVVLLMVYVVMPNYTKLVHRWLFR